METEQPIIIAREVDFYYGPSKALNQISLEIERQKVTAMIGPSGCGKSTFLRCLNRMNDTIPNTHVSGKILFEGMDIYAPGVDLTLLRQQVGMVFQRPNPFPQSIFDNVAFGPRVLGLVRNRHELTELVERSLTRAALWDSVKDILNHNALELPLGQQQLLCIARLLAVKPEVILMDEPASALDPIATERLENLIHELKVDYTIAIVTHNMQQAARISDFTAFFWLGELVEFSSTPLMFTRPQEELTENYITGRMG